MKAIFAPIWGILLLNLWFFTPSAFSQTDQAVYTDSLQNGWVNWSWSSSLNFSSGAAVHSGSAAIAVTITNAWGALYLHRQPFNSSPYASLSFWINGGAAGGQRIQVQGVTNQVAVNGVSYTVPALSANTWLHYTVPLSTLGVDNQLNLDGIWFMDQTGGAQPVFYVDDISLIAYTTPPPTVSLTSPANGAGYAAPATIDMAASVVANGHTITKVQFLNGTSALVEDTAAPYSYSWTNVPVGSYSLVARLFYDSGSTLDSAAANVTVTGTTPITINVDAQASRHPISPLIYGVAFADTSNELAQLNCPVHRSGGNSETRYNWQLNAHNHANDWYFESLDDGSSTPAGSADDFVAKSKASGAEPMLTIPMIGWVPKLGPGRARLASYSIAKYGPQTGSDSQWFPDAGNGISSTNGNLAITNNNPNDANFLTNSAFQQAFIQHLTNRWGLSTNGGVRYYFMDNEHSIWHSTHRDVHPFGATMAEIRDKIFDYAGVVKSLDPASVVLAPEEWGWSGYLYSGYDQQYGGQHGWGYLPDRAANGGMDYMPWLLSQLYQRATNTNQRLVDYFTLHCYPQANEFSSDVSTSKQLLRNQSTRQLWDTNYVDQSWINAKVMLIPRMKDWVAKYYPGTKIGITEYNWGAEGHINGATAQADIYGIFGREGLDLGTRWTCPASNTPTFKAMQMYRNYDGNDSGFGDVSVSASGPNPDNVSTFAALRSSDGALTIMIINKQLNAGAAVTCSVTNRILQGTGQVWQLTAANSITRLADIAVSGGTFSTGVPAQSITLFVLAAGTPPPAPVLRPGTVSSTNSFDLWLDGVAGQRYVLEATPDFVNWTAVATNTLASSSWHAVLPASPAPYRFYRARWAP